jgi:lambda family phage portal protein
MSWLTRMLGWGDGGTRVRRLQEEAFRRGFTAANKSRLFADWVVSGGTTTNEELNAALPTLQWRARELARNDRHMRRFLRLAVKNVVGTGFRLESKVRDPTGTLDQQAIAAIEQSWAAWARKGTCTVCGRFSFSQLHRKLVRDKARDGEYLVRRVRGWQGNAWRYALQQLPAEVLDHGYSTRLDGGNTVIMGVELDAWWRPVAYHLWDERPRWSMSSRVWTSGGRRRVPADEIIHGYTVEFEEQVRGCPWAHAAMADMHQYDGYLQAEVIAARLAACKSEYYETPADADPELVKSMTPAAEMEPGSGEVGLPGVKKHLLDPTHPSGNADMFAKVVERAMAAGLDVAYHTFSNDLRDANYGSIRAGTIDERDSWLELQDDEVQDLLVPVFEEWLELALLAGAIVMPNGTRLPATKYDKFRQHRWQGRRWQWVDPLKDAEANALAVKRLWKSDEQVSSEMGTDYYDNVADQERCRQAAGQLYDEQEGRQNHVKAEE